MDSIYSNVIVNTLFGWVKGLADWVWYILKDGEDISFLTWFGDNWLPVLIFLLLAGVVLDYLVWLLRWRPYLVWSTKIRKFFNAMTGKNNHANHYNRNNNMHETGKYNIARAVNVAAERLDQREQEYLDNGSDDDFREYVKHDAKTRHFVYDNDQDENFEVDAGENDYYNKPKFHINKRGKRKTAKGYTPPIQYIDELEEQEEYLDQNYNDQTIKHEYEEQYYDEDTASTYEQENEESTADAFEEYSDEEDIDEDLDEEYLDQGYEIYDREFIQVYDQNSGVNGNRDTGFEKLSDSHSQKGIEIEPYEDFEHYEELDYYEDVPEQSDDLAVQAIEGSDKELNEGLNEVKELPTQAVSQEDEVYFLNNQPLRKRLRNKNS